MTRFNLLASDDLARKEYRGTFATIAEAIDAIPRGVCFWEEDADHPGHADAFANDGALFTVEPVQ